MSKFLEYFDEEEISRECIEKLEMLEVTLSMLGYTESDFSSSKTMYFYLNGNIVFSIFKENMVLMKTEFESFKFKKKNLYNLQIVSLIMRKKIKNLSTKDLDINKTTDLLLLMIWGNKMLIKYLNCISLSEEQKEKIEIFEVTLTMINYTMNFVGSVMYFCYKTEHRFTIVKHNNDKLNLYIFRSSKANYQKIEDLTIEQIIDHILKLI